MILTIKTRRKSTEAIPFRDTRALLLRLMFVWQNNRLTALRSGLGTLFGFYKEVFLSSSSSSLSRTHLQSFDECLAYHLLLQAYDTVRTGSHTGWEKLLIAVHRLRTILPHQNDKDGRDCMATIHFPPCTSFALQIVTALATDNYSRFYHLLLLQKEAAVQGQRKTQCNQEKEGEETVAADTGSAWILVRCLLHKLLPYIRRRTLEFWSKTLFKKEKMHVLELSRLLCFSEDEEDDDDGEQAAAFVSLHQVQVVVEEGQGLGAGRRRYIEPRMASIHPLPISQTYEERKLQRQALAKRQDGLILTPAYKRDIVLLWKELGEA